MREASNKTSLFLSIILIQIQLHMEGHIIGKYIFRVLSLIIVFFCAFVEFNNKVYAQQKDVFLEPLYKEYTCDGVLKLNFCNNSNRPLWAHWGLEVKESNISTWYLLFEDVLSPNIKRVGFFKMEPKIHKQYEIPLKKLAPEIYKIVNSENASPAYRLRFYYTSVSSDDDGPYFYSTVFKISKTNTCSKKK